MPGLWNLNPSVYSAPGLLVNSLRQRRMWALYV